MFVVTRLKLFPAVLVMCLAFARPCAAQDDLDSGDLAAVVLGAQIGHTINEAVSDMAQLQSDSAKFSAEVRAARERYQQAVRTHSGDVAAAQANLVYKLYRKDLYYMMMLTYARGITGRDITPAQLDTFAGEVDGGINDEEWPGFVDWLDAVKKHLNGGHIGNLADIPGVMLDAVAASQPEYDNYVVVRDWHEMNAAGVQFTPAQFTLLAVRRYSGATNWVQAAQRRKYLYDQFGEGNALKAAARVLTIPPDNHGMLTDLQPLGFVLPASTRFSESRTGLNTNTPPAGMRVLLGAANPFNVLAQTLTVNDPKAYAVWVSGDNWIEPRNDYKLLVAAYGDPAVVKAADVVRTAPQRMEDGYVLDPAAIGCRENAPEDCLREILAAHDPHGQVLLRLAGLFNLHSAEDMQKMYAEFHASHDDAWLQKATNLELQKLGMQNYFGKGFTWESPKGRTILLINSTFHFNEPADLQTCYDCLAFTYGEQPLQAADRDTIKGWFRWRRFTNAYFASPPASAEKPAQGKAWSAGLPGDGAMAMAWIPPGKFVMGSPAEEPLRNKNEGPQTVVTLTHGFWLGKCEVTQAQWMSLMLENISLFTNAGPDAPVETINWRDAMAFCARLTEREREAGRLPAGYVYTLPTEAQWEYACRAGTTTATYAGDPAQYNVYRTPEMDPIAWYFGDSRVGYAGGCKSDTWSWYEGPYSAFGTHPVGQKKPNAFGLYDMLGNVAEWCYDHYSDTIVYPGGMVTDPVNAKGAHDEFAVRGGSWAPEMPRAAERDGKFNGLETIGFRVALAPPPEQGNPWPTPASPSASATSGQQGDVYKLAGVTAPHTAPGDAEVQQALVAGLDSLNDLMDQEAKDFAHSPGNPNRGSLFAPNNLAGHVKLKSVQVVNVSHVYGQDAYDVEFVAVYNGSGRSWRVSQLMRKSGQQATARLTHVNGTWTWPPWPK